MKNVKIFGLIISVGIIMNACITIGYPTGFGPQGGLFSSTKQGLGSNGKLDGSMSGSACVHSILYLATIGDGSAEKAAINGSITNIYTVNRTTLNILSLYTNLCTVVTGDNSPIRGANSGGVDNSANFNDVVTMKNGEVLTNVKAAVTADSIVIVSADGKTLVYKKSEVKGIKKNAK
ncbi:MAG: TRL domain-containing protein [Leptospira sp.]|nr:TRL domain-containing protein [Leptospira sp.]